MRITYNDKLNKLLNPYLESLLKEKSSLEPETLTLFDLFMEDSFGLTIAKSLRELFYRGRIVFCTASADYALESYSVYASGYIVYPYRLKDIRHTLDWLLQEYQSGSYGLVAKSSINFIPVNEIMYVESSNTKCILHRADGRTYHVYKKLNEIESELNDARFLRCHQSYLVNMNYVSEANDSFVLQNGDTVLIRAKSKRMSLQKVLEYKRWDKFNNIINNVKIALRKVIAYVKDIFPKWEK